MPEISISPSRYKEVSKGLSSCAWFHGTISRMEAVALVRENGQFLVRQSPNIADQFVLTGMYENVDRHVVLVNNEGKVTVWDGDHA